MSRLPRILGALCVLVALLAAGPAHAASGPPATPQLIERAAKAQRIDRDTATLYLAYALRRPDKLPRAYRSATPWDGTLPLLRLRDAVERMRPGRQRTEAEEIAASSADCGGDSTLLPLTRDTAHFHIEYATVGAGLSIDDYAASLEEAWAAQVDSFGWAAPPVAPTAAPGNRYHVRVEELGSGLYGFVSPDGVHAGLVGDNPNTAWNDVDAYATCMVVNDDFSGFPSSPQASLDSTTAHEFNHSLQFGYGALDGANVPDDVFVEGGATWMEDEVQDAANDNRFYLWPEFAESMGDYDGDSPYPYWIVFRGLAERYGAGVAGGAEDVMQRFWEQTGQGTGDNLTALEASLGVEGTNLADAFHAYAIAVKFNRACVSGYVFPYCFEEGPGYVGVAGSTPVDRSLSSVGSSTPNTGVEDNYALSWVSLPGSGAPYDVHLDNRSNGGQLRATVACDTGSGLDLSAFDTVADAHDLVTLSDYTLPSGCTAPIAVITNQAQTAPNPSTSATRVYRLSTSASGVAQHQLTVAVSGSGSVTSQPAGISCGSDCTEPYDAGTTVVLAATPASGWGFSGWSGEGCTGTGTCEVTLSAARSVTATFAELPPPPPAEPDPAPATTSTSTPPPLAAPDVVRPVVGSLRLTRTRFRAAAGTTIRYSLSEAARAAFRVERARPGRRVGRRCVLPTAANRRRPRCVRWLRVRGGFAQQGRPGLNSRRLPTRFAGRRLVAGRYRLVIAATDPAGNRGPARRIGFTIVR